MKENKFSSKGFFNWTFFVLIVAIAILVNVVSSYLNIRVDATKDKRYSLAESSKTYLSDDENFNNRLLLKIYLSGNLPADLNYFKGSIEDKLKEFKQFAGKRIEYEFIDPNIGTESEKNELYESLYNKGKGILPMDIVYSKDGQQSQLMAWPGAIIEYGGATVNFIQFLPGTSPGKPMRLEGMADMIQNSVNNLEYILMTSIRRSVEDTKKTIGFLQGHGELRFPETQRARALISPYYNLRDVTINDSLAALDDIDGLIIARPQSRFSDKELYVIDQFVMRGGRLMCFIDQLKVHEDTLIRTGVTHTTRIKTGLDKMLFDYGIKLNDNLVLDVFCAPKAVPLAKQSLIPWFYHVLATTSKHPIARNLEPVSLEYTSEIQFVDNKELVLSPILTSSPNSTPTGLAPMVSLAMPLNYGKNPKLVANPEDENNKICIAGLSEGIFTSHFKNRITDEFAKNPVAKFKEKASKEGKVFVVGNGRFIQNDYDSMPAKSSDQWMYRPKQYNDLRYNPQLAEMGYRLFFGNSEFFQNTVDYMMGDNSVLDIRSRQIDIHQIDKEKVSQHAGFYKWINLLLPNGIILLLALLFFYLRKRKYSA
jgi:ABC-2 type transport system permease protein